MALRVFCAINENVCLWLAQRIAYDVPFVAANCERNITEVLVGVMWIIGLFREML